MSEVGQMQDWELCSAEVIAPRCRIEELQHKGNRTYQISLNENPFVSTDSLGNARRIVQKLKHLKLCNYGSEFFAPPITQNLRSQKSDGKKPLPLLNSIDR